MSIDMMKQISQAEAQAVQLRADAQAEAKRAVDAGRKEAAAMVEAARKKADQAYREVMDQAEKAAQRDYNDYLEEPTIPTKGGYTFSHWELNGEKYEFNKPVTSDMELVAIWIINKYEIVMYKRGV